MAITSTKLFLKDFAVSADIGIHDFEKAARQRVLVSIEISVDPAGPDGGTTDEIAAVLDYDFLRQEIQDLVADRRFNLQETLCREIVAIVAARETVRAAVVSVRKPDVYPDSDSVGVEMTYER